jgi:Peptidase C80 family
MGKNFIINTQPDDAAATQSTERLQKKPLGEKWEDRLAFTLDRVKELSLSADDKVYLVGHGGDDGTLGGMSPIELAGMVRKHVLPAGQINLVMCGCTKVLHSAGTFTKMLQDGDDGYQGKVFAYSNTLSVDSLGHKWADQFEFARDQKVDITERLRDMPETVGQPRPVDS